MLGVVQAVEGKLLKAVLLVASTNSDPPQGSASSISPLLGTTSVTVPVTKPNCAGVGAAGSSETVTPLAAARFTERSD